MLTDSHRILDGWRKHFSQLLNVHGFNYVRQREINATEPIVLEPSVFELQMAIGKLKKQKSPGTGQILGQFVKSGGGRIIRSKVHKIINSVWSKEDLFEQWKESLIIPIYKKGNKIYCISYRGTTLFLTTYQSLSTILQSRLTPYAEEIIGDHMCGFRHNRSTAFHIFCIR